MPIEEGPTILTDHDFSLLFASSGRGAIGYREGVGLPELHDERLPWWGGA